MLKSDCDAPPTSQGQYATPATPMCDDDPSMSRDEEDVPPANAGRYAMPVTTGHDDESTIKLPISESALTVRKVPV
jgi:hypothetical protein